MLLLLIAIIVLVAVIYYINNDSKINTEIKKLNECPDVFTSNCDVNPCNCISQRNKPKYQKTVNDNGVNKNCYYCGKKCVTELNEPNNIKIKNTNEIYLVNDVQLNSDGILIYAPEYAYLEGDIVDCVCANDNVPIRKNIIIQDSNGEIIEKTGYICGGDTDGGRKYAKNDLTKDIFLKITADREFHLNPITEVDVTNTVKIITQTGDNSELKKQFASNINEIVNANVNANIGNFKPRGGACPLTQPNYYLNKANVYVGGNDYIFSGNPEFNDNVTTSCSINDVCDCSNNDEMLWIIKDNEGMLHDCKTCGKLICPNDEDVYITKYTYDNGVNTLLNCSEIMYNNLNNEYLNKCQCNNGRQLKRMSYELDGKMYTCDTCEEIVNACPANTTLDDFNQNKCTLDPSCKCPRDHNGELLVKYETIYYDSGGNNIRTLEPTLRYKACSVCGFSTTPTIYDFCEDKKSCDISSKLQVLLNDIDSEIQTIIDTGNIALYVNDTIKARVSEYVKLNNGVLEFTDSNIDKELQELNYQCLQKHTIFSLFYDILTDKIVKFTDTANQLAKKKTCNDIANMSSEIDTGDGVNCRYDFDENKLFSIMGQLTYEKDYKVSALYERPTENKRKLSNIIKYYSDDIDAFNYTLRNCSKTCEVDYKKHYNVNPPQQNRLENLDDCNKLASLYCPSYSNIDDNSFVFSKRVKDFCLNKDDKCNVFTYVKSENDDYINNRVKNLCPNACWKCDEIAVINAKESIAIKNRYAEAIGMETISKEEENNIITNAVNVSAKLRNQINAGLDVLTSTAGFTKYIEDLNFNILDMVNIWDFKYGLANDAEFINKCAQIDESGAYNYLELADCHLVDSIDKVDAAYRSKNGEILKGIYGYCKSPEKSNWMRSIMENCAKSSPNEKSPICLQVDNSNSFPFKLDGVKDCFGTVVADGSKPEEMVNCINKKLSTACIGEVRDLQANYDIECKQNFSRCVASNYCGTFRQYATVKYDETPECKTNNCMSMVNYDIPDDKIPKCNIDQKRTGVLDEIVSFFNFGAKPKTPQPKNPAECDAEKKRYKICSKCNISFNEITKREKALNEDYLHNGVYDNTKVDERLKNNPLCLKCIDGALNCATKNKWEKKKNIKYPTHDVLTSGFYKVDECPPNTSLCVPPKRGSLDFSFWVDDAGNKVPERENEFKWYINNWWKGYRDDNTSCKGKWVLKYNDKYCDTNTCNLTDMSFNIKISNDVTKSMAISKNLAKYLKIAMNEYIYQHQVGSYNHIGALLSKIMWATKDKANPNPECGVQYDKYLFNNIVVLLTLLKTESSLKSGIPINYRQKLEQMLRRLSNISPEKQYCSKNKKSYVTGNTKISQVDLAYLLSSRQYLFFNDTDINNMYNTLNPNSVQINVTLVDDNIATFNVDFKNITFDIAENIKNIFNTQNLQKYNSVNDDLFIKYLFNTFTYNSGSSFINIFKDLLTNVQINNTMIALNGNINLGGVSGIASSNYIWLYEKEDATQLIECDKAKIKGFVGEFTNLNIDILPGNTYSGMEACTKNTALFFAENKCNLQQLVSEKKIPCSDFIINREMHYTPNITKSCI